MLGRGFSYVDFGGPGQPLVALHGTFTRADFVADAAAFVTELGLAPALVLGHSLGGVNAIQLAAWHPDLV